MKLYHLFIGFACCLLVSCTENSPAAKHEIYEVKNIGMLSTTEYTVGKIVKLSDNGEWYTWGDRKILMSCKAKIKAGVNMNTISEKDIKTDGKRIEIQLPPAQIVSFEMDPDQIHTEMVDVNGLRANFTQNEKNKIMQLGEKAIREDLKDLNILTDAENNAKAFLSDFYKELGFEEIIIHGTQKSKGD